MCKGEGRGDTTSQLKAVNEDTQLLLFLRLYIYIYICHVVVIEKVKGQNGEQRKRVVEIETHEQPSQEVIKQPPHPITFL